MAKKLISIDNLHYFRILLQTCKSRKQLLEYFDRNILEQEKQDINDLKRVIYILMKKYKDFDTNKYNQYYILYQNIKNGMDYNTALKIFSSIV